MNNNILDRLDKTRLVFSVAIYLSVMLWSYFLYASKASIGNLIQFTNYAQTFENVFSIWFMLFLVMLSLSMALIALAARAMQRKPAHVTTAVFSALALLTALFAFNLWHWAAPMIFFLGSVPLMVETAQSRLMELERFQLFRSVWQASHKGVWVITAGLFLSTAIFAYSNQAQYVNQFEQGFLDLAISATPAGDELNDQAANIFIGYQRQLVDQLMQTTQFQRLENKNDPEVQEFVATIQALRIAVDTPEFKNQIKEQISQNNAANPKQLINIELLKQQSPVISDFFTLIENYYWLIAALAIAGFFSFIGGIIVVPLSAVLGWAIGQFTRETELKKSAKPSN